MHKDFAQKLIQKTREDYNTISTPFSSTRAYVPQDLKDLTKYITPGDNILDLGCGNGRFSEVVDAKKATYTGADISEGLLREAGKKYPGHKFDVIDFPKPLPYEDNTFDAVFCLATIHHIPSVEYRKAFLSEVKRVLKPNSRLILTSWYLLNDPDIRRQLFYQKVASTFRLSPLDPGDLYYPYKDQQGKVLAERYIHCFSQNELASLVDSVKFNIEENFLQSRGNKNNQNICIIAKKDSS